MTCRFDGEMEYRMYALSDTKDFRTEELTLLFHSVGWDLTTDPLLLQTAMKNSTTIISAWDGNKLVGIIRSMDDSVWSANIDCLLVHKDYHGRGIGTALLTELLARIGHIEYISVSPSDPSNNSFYEKQGFKKIEGSSLLQRVK